MGTGAVAAILYSIFLLFYFAVLNSGYLFLIFIAFFQLRQVSLSEKIIDRDRSFRSGFFKPISIIIPAFNEEKTVVETVRSALSLRYPDFEVIVVSDGSTDKTIAELTRAFALQARVRDFRAELPTAPVRKIYTSADYPNLAVIDKNNGGKSDALNAGINLAQFPLICNIDSDSLIDAEALLKVTDIFVQDWRVVAAGGTIRAANGMRIEEGTIKEVSLTSNFWVRFQIIEYLRAFLFGRAGWSSLNGLMILSGAFSIFRRSAVVQAGGYLTNTIGEDMELVLRVQRTMKETQRPYRVVFLPDPVCWTQVPENYGNLQKQRRRWQRGLSESLFLNFQMFLNPQYGSVGLLSFPFFLFFEFLGPLIELSGYAVLIYALFTGLLNPSFALLFLAVAVLLGVFISVFSLLLEEIFYSSYKRTREVLILFAFAVMENLFYRQLHTWWRCLGFIDFLFKRGDWGIQTRKSFNP